MNGNANLVLNDVSLQNAGTLTTAPAAKITFTGSTDNTMDAGGATISNLEMDKNGGAKVTLTSDVIVSEDLSFGTSENYLDLDASDLTLDADATVTGADSDNYVIATGAGSLEKQFSSASAFTYPVGDAVEYSPIDANVTGTMGAAAAVKVNVTDADHPNLPSEATDYISRYWNVVASDITGYSNTLTGTYVPADVTGMAANVKGASYATAWNYADAEGVGSSAVGTTTELDADFSATNFFGQADLKVLLQGAHNAGTMSTSLTLPLTSPYADAPLTVASIPAGATDWIKIEVRDAASPSTVVSKHSAFLMSDGSIAGEDGTSLPLLKDADPTGYVALYHRNHLPIRSSSALDLVNTTLFDFTTGMGQAYNDAGVSNGPMVDLGSGVFGMYGGDTNGDGYVRYTDGFIPPVTSIPSDALSIFSALGNVSNGQSTDYLPTDVNLDGYVRYTDGFIPPVTSIPSDALRIFTILGNTSNAQVQQNID